MENRNRHSSHALLMNAFACIAVVAVAVALSVYGYFQFRAREEEAKQMQGAASMMSEALKAQKGYWENLDKQTEKLNQPPNPAQPSMPQSDAPPPQLPKYGTPESQ